VPLLSSSHSVPHSVINDSLLYTQVTERSATNVENCSTRSPVLSAIAFPSVPLKLMSPSRKRSSLTGLSLPTWGGGESQLEAHVKGVDPWTFLRGLSRATRVCFTFLGWGDLVHLVRRPPALCERWWMWSSRWNENWQGKRNYSEKTCPSATLSTTNPTWSDLGSNPGRLGGKSTTYLLSCGTAHSDKNFVLVGAGWKELVNTLRGTER
jgi:hypothetical protein